MVSRRILGTMNFRPTHDIYLESSYYPGLRIGAYRFPMMSMAKIDTTHIQDNSEWFVSSSGPTSAPTGPGVLEHAY